MKKTIKNEKNGGKPITVKLTEKIDLLFSSKGESVSNLKIKGINILRWDINGNSETVEDRLELLKARESINKFQLKNKFLDYMRQQIDNSKAKEIRYERI